MQSCIDLQIDALEARFGQAMGYKSGSREVLQQLSMHLSTLEAELGPVPSGWCSYCICYFFLDG